MCDIFGASVCDLKNIIGLKKYIMYFLSNNCCDKCPEIEKNLHVFIKKRQCVTLEEILNTGQAKHRGLGGCPVCFFEREAKFLDCSEVNFDEF